MAQVHRFGNQIAIALPGSTATAYLTLAEAELLRRAIVDCSSDIANHEFADSGFRTVSFETDGKRKDL